MLKLLLLIVALVLVKSDKPCQKRLTTYGSVCVCNATYCDTVPDIIDLNYEEYQLFSTSEYHMGFTSTIANFSSLENDNHNQHIVLSIPNLTPLDQTVVIIGFGGAFTDSAGINILKLSEGAQENLLQAYFGQKGIQYSLGRIPIGGTDFSIRGYTYCDQCDDGSLDGFSLQEEDFKYKIPLIQRATEIRGPENIKYFGSAWVAPVWMKTNGNLTGKGTVKQDYLDLWAQYHLKFLEAYKDYGIDIWGLTTQNEPVNGIIGSKIPANGYTTGLMIKWIRDALGPAVRNSSFKDLKIMLHDEQRVLLPVLSLFILSDSKVLEYADGIAVHWYSDKFTAPITLTLASSEEKNLFRVATEACTGYEASSGIEKSVELGNWQRAEQYLDSIMDDLKYGFGGWVDWNIALNEQGGPNYYNNEVDSPIIINDGADEFYKQPMFYAVGHFSKFIVTDSVRIDVEIAGNGVESLAFLRPDGKVAVVVRNRSDNKKTIKLIALQSVGTFEIDAHSINTVLFLPK